MTKAFSVLILFDKQMLKDSNNESSAEVPKTKEFSEKWFDSKMNGKIIFLLSLLYIVLTYSLLMSFPSITLTMYCIAFPMLFAIRIYYYTKTKSFLYLFDNCYFVNTALILCICFNCPMDSVFLSIFAAVNGPVLWAVLPFRNTLAFHDLDKLTSCYIHWAPTLVTWTVRWFPATTSIGWLRMFGAEDMNISPVYQWHDKCDWFWFVAVPIGFLVLHDIIYAVIVHLLIKPSEEYSDSFTYQRSKDNVIGNSIRKCPLKLQLPFYMLISFALYFVGILFSILCYRMFLIHTVLISAQLIIMIWNGGCYYLDYFAYMALKVQDLNEDKSTDKLITI